MIYGYASTCFSVAFKHRLYRKLLLFKSFTAGLTVKEFDNICNKEISKRYHKP
jgi:hypothetical protein